MMPLSAAVSQIVSVMLLLLNRVQSDSVTNFIVSLAILDRSPLNATDK